MSTIPFANFTKGELSRELQARIDTNQYSAASRKVRNFIIQRYGGLSLRPGFRLVAEVDDVSKDIRYIPFQFNIDQSYIMAMEDQRMRLLVGGGVVVEQNIKITALTKAVTPTVTAAFHKYVVGDRINFSGVVGMTEINGRNAIVVSVIDVNNFTINLNTSGFTTFVSSDGDIRTVLPTDPAAASALPTVTLPTTTDPSVTEAGGTGALIGGLTSGIIPTEDEAAYLTGAGLNPNSNGNWRWDVGSHGSGLEAYP